MERRDRGLDALRGLAVLALAFSWLNPSHFSTAFKPAQLVMPQGLVDASKTGMNLPDLILPLMVFALGASIPLAWKDRTTRESVFRSLQRLALLILLALAFGPLRGNQHAGPQGWWDALMWMAFATLAVIRLPKLFTPPSVFVLRTLGIGGIVFGMLQYPLAWGQADSALLLIALIWPVTLIGWYLTRERPGYRLGLGILLVVLGSFVKREPLVEAHLFEANAFGWYDLRWVGLALAASCVPCADPLSERKVECGLASCTCVLACLSVFVFRGPQIGLAWVSLVILGGITFSLAKEKSALTWRVIGCFAALVAALVCAPLGLQRDPGTAGVMFFALGLGTALNLLLGYVADKTWRPEKVQVSLAGFVNFAPKVESLSLEPSPRPGFLAAVGENPLLGYLGLFNIWYPVTRLTGAQDWMMRTFSAPSEQFLSALVQTLAFGLVISLFSRMRVFARA